MGETNEVLKEGHCQCGCGLKTKIVNGKPNRFINHHNTNGKNNPMWDGGKRIRDHSWEIWTPDRGYVKEHILIVEKVFERKLPQGAIVHHVNKNPFDNSKKNLVLCENQGFHLYLHKRERALKSCGHANWEKCKRCCQYDNPENMECIDVSQNRRSHKKCEREYAAECRERKRQRKFGY